MHPGSGDIVRLIPNMPNFGGFHVVVFGGNPSSKSNAVTGLSPDVKAA